MIIIIVLIMLYYAQQETNSIRRIVSWVAIGLVVFHYITSNDLILLGLAIVTMILWLYKPE